MLTFENVFKAENEVHKKMHHFDKMLHQVGFSDFEALDDWLLNRQRHLETINFKTQCRMSLNLTKHLTHRISQ